MTETPIQIPRETQYSAPADEIPRLPCPPWPGAFPLATDYGRDVPESWIHEVAPIVLYLLLADRTTGNCIIWATEDYAGKGEGFGFFDEIIPERILSDRVIRPRVDKRLDEQKARISAKGEVFTPAWVCNAQNNLIDQAWFGSKKPIFNEERGQDWLPTDNQTLWSFMRTPGRKDGDYIALPRMEASCGEAPYLTSRYDAATGEMLPVARRIGLLDRKLRVVSGKAQSREKWIALALDALRSVYAFEWQGDSLLIARENLLFATLEAFATRWPDTPALPVEVVERFASVLSWNVFQMDGIKLVVPLSCHDETPPPIAQTMMSFGDDAIKDPVSQPCPGCATGGHRLHNGVRPLVVDWSLSPFERRAVPFHELFQRVSP